MDGVLVAYEYFVPAKVTDMVYKVGSVLFVVVALLLGGNIYILVLINGALAFLTQLYKFIYWHRKTNLSPNLRFKDRAEQQSLFSFSGWTFLGGLAHRFRLGFVSTILGIFSNSEQIAIFSLGLVMEAMTWTLSSALNGLFLPKVSRLAVDNNNAGIMELMIRVGRIQLYIIFAIFSVIVLFGKPFIDLWVGDKFADVYYIVICLTFAHLLGNTLQIAVDKAYADNKIKHLTRVTFTTSLIGLVFSCMLAEQFGLLMGEVFSEGLESSDARIAANMGRAVGHWIYLVDAADDFDEDRKRNRFNPYRKLFGDTPSEADWDNLRNALTAHLLRAERRGGR